MQTSYVQVSNQRIGRDGVESFYRKPLPHLCIDFQSAEGKRIFSEALVWGCMESFFKLSPQLRTQDDVAMSGLASLVTVLNAFTIDPGRIWKAPWRWYDEKMLAYCNPSEVFLEEEINMSQFIGLANHNGLYPKAIYGSKLRSLENLRNEVYNATQREDVALIANYDRRILGQIGDGHFAPIGGYHPGRDLVLILDTARFIYPPHWIQLEALWNAMRSIDKNTGSSDSSRQPLWF